MAEIAAPTPDDDQQDPSADITVASEVATETATAADTVADSGATEATAAADANGEAGATGEATATGAAPVTTEADSTPAAEPVDVAPVATPEPIAPAPVVEPTPPAPIPSALAEPSLTSTIEVPASVTASADGEGGEWALLLDKLGDWLRSGQLQQQWQAARQPLGLVAGLIAVLLVLRIYGALLGVLDSLPLLPGLLELAGVIAVVRFSLTRLVRSEERRSLIEGLQQRWKAFRGKG